MVAPKATICRRSVGAQYDFEVRGIINEIIIMQMQTVTINFTGGIVSPGYLKDILELALEARVEEARFGLRQQMRMEIPTDRFDLFAKQCQKKGIAFYTGKEASPNLVSSYPAADIFTEESWMREGVYKDIFDAFTHSPRLKINICDRLQNFVPFYTGHINWVSSSAQHFWHLYIRFPKTARVYKWKERVYTNDIPQLSEALEREILLREEHVDSIELAGDELFYRIKSTIKYISKEASVDPPIDFSLPYYEGFNKMNNQLWLGIYRRSETFPLKFLLDICNLCTQTRVGQFYTTPWKSIIIKNIDPSHRKLWDRILGHYRINVRHAANELNWQIEDDSERGRQIKGHIIRHFDKEDVRTYGLCFAVQTKPSSKLFGSVLIRMQENKNPNKSRALDRYDILYKKEFNPNTDELIPFREGIEKEHISTYLVSLCKYFYGEHNIAPLVQSEQASTEEELVRATKTLNQCKHCLTVYVPGIGDEAQGVIPGTAFKDLPSSYGCPLCEGSKGDFVEIEVPVSSSGVL